MIDIKTREYTCGDCSFIEGTTGKYWCAATGQPVELKQLNCKKFFIEFEVYYRNET